MSFIKQSPIGYEESLVLKFALQKVVPHFENVVHDANGERKVRAQANLDAAKDMLTDLEESLDTANVRTVQKTA
jgi:hypothetical protein